MTRPGPGRRIFGTGISQLNDPRASRPGYPYRGRDTEPDPRHIVEVGTAAMRLARTLRTGDQIKGVLLYVERPTRDGLERLFDDTTAPPDTA